MSNVKIIPAKKWAAKKEKWLAQGRNELRGDLLFAVILEIGNGDVDKVDFWREVGYFIETCGIAIREDLVAEHRANSGWWDR